MAYEFAGTKKLIAGEDAIGSIPNEVANLKGRKPLIVTDSGIAKTDLLKRVISVLDGQKMSYGVFSEVEPEPEIAMVEKGKKAFLEGKHDILIAFGGGSAIDATKSISLLATNEGSFRDYLGGRVIKNDPVSIVAVPTTAGTGSEATSVAIVTDEDKKVKCYMKAPQLLPKSVILDPTLLGSLPPTVIAYTGIDAFTHAVESLLSVRSNLITQQFSLSAIRLIYSSLIPFKDNPKNIELASKMLIASCFAGIAISAGTGAVHAIGHGVGSYFHLPHGITMALFLCPVLKENKDVALEKYRIMAETLGGDLKGLSNEDCAEKFIGAIDEFVGRLGLPRRLSEMKITDDLPPTAIGNIMKDPIFMANPKKYDEDTVRKIVIGVR